VGKGSYKTKGNVLLRQLVQKHSVEYSNAKSRADKAEIGSHIVRLVASRTNGSFWRVKTNNTNQESQNEEMEKLDDEAARRVVQNHLSKAIRKAKRPKAGGIGGPNDTSA
jgi:hypothetical protein